MYISVPSAHRTRVLVCIFVWMPYTYVFAVSIERVNVWLCGRLIHWSVTNAIRALDLDLHRVGEALELSQMSLAPVRHFEFEGNVSPCSWRQDGHGFQQRKLSSWHHRHHFVVPMLHHTGLN
jgi:hypothetical protein